MIKIIYVFMVTFLSSYQQNRLEALLVKSLGRLVFYLVSCKESFSLKVPVSVTCWRPKLFPEKLPEASSPSVKGTRGVSPLCSAARTRRAAGVSLIMEKRCQEHEWMEEDQNVQVSSCFRHLSCDRAWNLTQILNFPTSYLNLIQFLQTFRGFCSSNMLIFVL